MGRKILAIIAGYIVMSLFLFIVFTVIYLILGTEGSFKPESFEVSTTWVISSVIVSFAAAMLGGYVCAWIAKNKKTAMILAGLVFVLGIMFALPELSAPADNAGKVRSAELSSMEAMQQAKQPTLTLILNPLIGAFGIFMGARLRKDEKSA